MQARAETGEIVSATLLCGAIADEIGRSRAIGMRLEQALCALTARLGLDVERVRELQELDLILQNLDALQDFLRRAAHGASPLATIELNSALAYVNLGEMKQRLSAGLGLGGEAAGEVNAGDVDFL